MFGCLSDLGGHLRLSEALLEPSLAKKDALPTRETRRPGPGERVWGRGKPLPEGEEGVWRRNLSKPLTPLRAGGIQNAAKRKK